MGSCCSCAPNDEPHDITETATECQTQLSFSPVGVPAPLRGNFNSSSSPFTEARPLRSFGFPEKSMPSQSDRTAELLVTSNEGATDTNAIRCLASNEYGASSSKGMSDSKTLSRDAATDASTGALHLTSSESVEHPFADTDRTIWNSGSLQVEASQLTPLSAAAAVRGDDFQSALKPTDATRVSDGVPQVRSVELCAFTAILIDERNSGGCDNDSALQSSFEKQQQVGESLSGRHALVPEDLSFFIAGAASVSVSQVVMANSLSSLRAGCPSVEDTPARPVAREVERRSKALRGQPKTKATTFATVLNSEEQNAVHSRLHGVATLSGSCQSTQLSPMSPRALLAKKPPPPFSGFSEKHDSAGSACPSPLQTRAYSPLHVASAPHRKQRTFEDVVENGDGKQQLGVVLCVAQMHSAPSCGSLPACCSYAEFGDVVDEVDIGTSSTEGS